MGLLSPALRLGLRSYDDSFITLIGLESVCLSSACPYPPGEQVRAVLADEGLEGVARSIVPPGARLPPEHKQKNICMILKNISPILPHE